MRIFPAKFINCSKRTTEGADKIDSKLSAYISDQGSGFSKQTLGKVDILLFSTEYLNCAKRTIKGDERNKLQTQRIHFGSGIRFLQARSWKS